MALFTFQFPALYIVLYNIQLCCCLLPEFAIMNVHYDHLDQYEWKKVMTLHTTFQYRLVISEWRHHSRSDASNSSTESVHLAACQTINTNCQSALGWSVYLTKETSHKTQYTTNVIKKNICRQTIWHKDYDTRLECSAIRYS